MTIQIDEFKAYLAIDKTALDDEVIQQPELFYTASEAYAEAAAERDALKEHLATVDAELDNEIRKQAKDKMTEGAIKTQIQLSPKHKKAFDAWLDAKELADKMLGLKEAFKDRSYMLRELGQLHASNYFEEGALKPTAKLDAAVYNTQRARLAAGRDQKKGTIYGQK